MPSMKSDIYITVRCGEKSFAIGSVMQPDSRYAIKQRGRSWAKKMPTATVTEIFNTARKWAVKNGCKL